MKNLMKVIALTGIALLSNGLIADDWSQNDQYYFVDDDDASAIHQADNQFVRASLKAVDISLMEVRGLRIDGDNTPSLFDLYMSSEQ